MSTRGILGSCFILSQLFIGTLQSVRDCKCVPVSLCLSDEDFNVDFGQNITESGHAFYLMLRRYSCANAGDICCKTWNIRPFGQCGLRNFTENDSLRHPEAAEAGYGEFPWLTIVYGSKVARVTQSLDYAIRATGTLIHPQAILTVAEPFWKYQAENLRVELGLWYEPTEGPFPIQRRNVSKIIVHEAFDETNRFANYAILILSEPVKIAPNVRVSCLSIVNDSLDQRRCVVSAWRKRQPNESVTHLGNICKLEIPVVPESLCQRAFVEGPGDRFYSPHPSLICAGGFSRMNMCQADVGSPLTCPYLNDPSRYALVGMVSGFGSRCETMGVPQIFVRIDNAREWIDRKMKAEKLTTFDAHS